MNILMLGRWLPPSRKPVRATREYQFARRLSRKHRLTLAFVNDHPDAAGPISALRTEFNDLEFASVPRGWRSLAGALSLATGESCTLSYFRSEALRTRLADRVRRAPYDLVFVTSSSMLQYALGLDAAIPLLVDFGCVDSEWWAAQAARSSFPSDRFFRTEAVRLRVVESAAARRAVRCVVATREAARVVQSLAPGVPTSVIANGLDLEFFGATPRFGLEPTVVLNAALGAERDLAEVMDFGRKITPLVRARVPKARFVLSVRDPLVRVKPPVDLPGLEITGVSTDLRTLFHSHAVAVVPPAAGLDVRSTVLEPMAAGIPVVGGRHVCDELGAKASQALVACEAVGDFEMKIVHLLEDESFRSEVGAQGRAYVAAHYAWDVLTPRLSEIVDSLAPPTGPRTALTSAPLREAEPADARPRGPLGADMP